MANKLTAKEVEALAKQQGMHSDGGGLNLQVKGDARSWIHRYTFNGEARYSGLGAWPEVSLADARAKRDDERAKLRNGIDPVAERKQKRTEEQAGERPRKKFKDAAKT
jgi:Arm DNA-binding domain